MSLLLDALKKAEKAKDDAKRRDHLADGSLTDDSVTQVRTRNELPDISRPLEMHSEDVTSRSTATSNFDSPVPDAFSTAPRQAMGSGSNSEPGTGADSRRGQAQDKDAASNNAQVAQRAAAKQVFEAKFREPNPKLPFYITMAVLGMFALGTVVYFWFQLRPPPPLVNSNAKAPADEKKVEIKPVPSVAGLLPAQVPGPSTLSDQQAIPGLPGSPQTSNQLPSPTAPKGSASSTNAPMPVEKKALQTDAAKSVAPDVPQPVRQRGPSQARRAVADPSQVSVSRPASAINPKLESAWTAYNRGDLSTARFNYLETLKEEPANRDALLGMAAVEVRSNRLDEAEGYYRNLLQLNPRDPYAQTGLISLRGPVGDASLTESRVKSLLVSEPESLVLHFTLGNQYAQQGRWPEAQQAYFKAFSGDPENPDFAYNLAVSLDRVRQPKLALEYYRRAVALSQQRSSSFDQTLARNRVQELAK